MILKDKALEIPGARAVLVLCAGTFDDDNGTAMSSALDGIAQASKYIKESENAFCAPTVSVPPVPSGQVPVKSVSSSKPSEISGGSQEKTTYSTSSKEKPTDSKEPKPVLSSTKWSGCCSTWKVGEQHEIVCA